MRRTFLLVAVVLVLTSQVGTWWLARDQLAPAALYSLLSSHLSAVDPVKIPPDGPHCVVAGDGLLSGLSSSRRAELSGQATRLGIELYERNRLPVTLTPRDCVGYLATSEINFPVIGRVEVYVYSDQTGGFDVWLFPLFGHWLTLWQSQTRF